MEKTIPSIKEIVKDNEVNFEFYRAGFFYYSVSVGDYVYQFPVDREDVGDASLNARDKAMFFMRWIRKAIDGNQFIVIQDNSLPDIKCEKCGEQLIARLEFMTGECDSCMFPPLKYDEDYVEDKTIERKLVDKSPTDFSILGSNTEEYYPERPSKNKDENPF